MAVPATRRTIGQLLQQGWNEIPEVLASTGLALTGIVMGTVGCYKYYNRDGDNRKYKMVYIIMRPDDPRVEKIRRN